MAASVGSRPARRAATAVVLGVTMSAALAVVAGAGNTEEPQRPPKTIPTLPPGTEVVSTSEPAGSSEPTPASLPVLRPGAGVSEILALRPRLLHVTDDVAGDLLSIVPLAAPFPTPGDADVSRVAVLYETGLDSYNASVTFTSAAAPDDVLLFFEATLADSSYRPSVGPTPNDPDDEALGVTVGYAAPDAGDGQDALLLVEIAPRGGGSVVDLILSDDFDLDILWAFSGWAPAVPGVDPGARPSRAVAVFERTDGDGEIVRLETAYTLDQDPAVVVDEFRQQLADSAIYRFADGGEPAEDEQGRTVARLAPASRIPEELSLTFEPLDDGCRLTVSGSL